MTTISKVSAEKLRKTYPDSQSMKQSAASHILRHRATSRFCILSALIAPHATVTAPDCRALRFSLRKNDGSAERSKTVSTLPKWSNTRTTGHHAEARSIHPRVITTYINGIHWVARGSIQNIIKGATAELLDLRFLNRLKARA